MKKKTKTALKELVNLLLLLSQLLISGSGLIKEIWPHAVQNRDYYQHKKISITLDGLHYEESKFEITKK